MTFYTFSSVHVCCFVLWTLQFGAMGCESIQMAMKSCPNPDALEPMEEEEEEEYEGSDDYEDGEDIDEQDLVEELDEEEEDESETGAKKYADYCNDTTQVVDDDDYDQSAYVTSVGFHTKVFLHIYPCSSHHYP